MMFWRLYGGRRFTGEYIGGRFEFSGYTGFNFRAGIHPGKPASEYPNHPSHTANVTDGFCTVYTTRNLITPNEDGEGDYIRWEGRWWKVKEEMRHGILIPHNRYICELADLPIADAINLVDIFVTIKGLGTVTGEGSVPAGSSVTLEAFPADEYKFVEWYRGDEDLTIKTPVYTFDAPPRGAVITCTFEKIETTPDPGDGGGG